MRAMHRNVLQWYVGLAIARIPVSRVRPTSLSDLPLPPIVERDSKLLPQLFSLKELRELATGSGRMWYANDHTIRVEIG